MKGGGGGGAPPIFVHTKPDIRGGAVVATDRNRPSSILLIPPEYVPGG